MDLSIMDLRIGNLIAYNGITYRVSDILSSNTVILHGIDESIQINDLAGLLINESILIKLGAKKTDTENLVRYKIEIKDFLSIYFCVSDGEISNSYLFVVQDSKTAARFNMGAKNTQTDDRIIQSVSFIHELQNLFFAFNRNEINFDILL